MKKLLLLSVFISLLSGKVYERDGYAIRAYDTVAYFTQGKAVKGKKSISYKYKGVIWLFSNQIHKDLFVANPLKYEPAYGGHCAYAMWNDYIAPINPYAWTIKNNRLFLNYSHSIRRAWLKGGKQAIFIADKNWLARDYQY